MADQTDGLVWFIKIYIFFVLYKFRKLFIFIFVFSEFSSCLALCLPCSSVRTTTTTTTDGMDIFKTARAPLLKNHRHPKITRQHKKVDTRLAFFFILHWPRRRQPNLNALYNGCVYTTIIIFIIVIMNESV